MSFLVFNSILPLLLANLSSLRVFLIISYNHFRLCFLCCRYVFFDSWFICSFTLLSREVVFIGTTTSFFGAFYSYKINWSSGKDFLRHFFKIRICFVSWLMDHQDEEWTDEWQSIEHSLWENFYSFHYCLMWLSSLSSSKDIRDSASFLLFLYYSNSISFQLEFLLMEFHFNRIIMKKSSFSIQNVPFSWKNHIHSFPFYWYFLIEFSLSTTLLS